MADDRNDWFRLCFALAALGEPGREFFHRLARLSPKYDETENDAKFSEALKNRNGEINIGTFFYLCKEAGIEPQKKRGRVTEGKINTAIRDAQRALGDQGWEYPIEEVESAVNHAIQQRKNPGEATPAPLPHDAMDAIQGAVEPVFMPVPRHYGTGVRDEIAKYLAKKWDFYEDTSTGLYYCRAVGDNNPNSLRPFTAKHRFINDLRIDLERGHFNKSDVTGPTIVETIFSSYTLQDINLLGEHLRYLGGKWDRVDRVKVLLRTMKTDNDEFFERIGTKYLLNVIAQAFCDSSGCRNEHALVLTGKQGIGKTRFFQELLWNNKFLASAPNFDFENKEHLLLMATHLLILLDEMGSIKKAELATMKAAFSWDVVKADRKYQETGTYRRVASFAGGTNEDTFLRDDTGDRRFIVFEVSQLDHAAYTAVDKAQLWGQLYCMWELGDDFHLTEDEKAVITTRNRDRFAEEKKEHAFIHDQLIITGDLKDFVSYRELGAELDRYRHAHNGQGFWDVKVVNNCLKQDPHVESGERGYAHGTRGRGFRGVRFAAPPAGGASW